MMRFFILLSMAVIAFTSSAATPKLDYLNVLAKYDVADKVKELSSASAAEFWVVADTTNEWLIEYRINMAKMKSAEKETLKQLEKLPRIDEDDSELILNSWQPKCDSLITELGVNVPGDSMQVSLFIIDYDDAIAFTALTRNGTAVCITEPLMMAICEDSLLLKSIVARELARLMLCQRERGVYDSIRNTKGGGSFLFFSIGGAPGVMVSIPLAIFKSNKPKKKGKNPLSKYLVKYSREQELEAELLAFRFMQHIGAGDAYVESIAFYGPKYDKLINKYAETTAKEWSRTDFLNSVKVNSLVSNAYFPSMKNERLKKAAKQAAKAEAKHRKQSQ